MRLRDPVVSTVVDIIRTQATSDRAALVFEGREISYRTLAVRSSQAAQAMRGAGVNPGGRVAFLDKNRPEYFELLFGAAKLNAVCVCVNWRLATREVLQVLTDAAATVLFVGKDLADHVDQIEELLPDTLIVSLDGPDRWVEYEVVDWLAARR